MFMVVISIFSCVTVAPNRMSNKHKTIIVNLSNVKVLIWIDIYQLKEEKNVVLPKKCINMFDFLK